MPTIRVDDDVYSWLQGQGRAFEDTPNSVLRRIAGLEQEAQTAKPPTPKSGTSAATGQKTPQSAYRDPIIRALVKHGGQAARKVVLDEVRKTMEGQLNAYDKEDIESGGPRWQKTAEYQVLVMRKARLLKAVDETPHGYWALTERGKELSRST